MTEENYAALQQFQEFQKLQTPPPSKKESKSNGVFANCQLRLLMKHDSLTNMVASSEVSSRFEDATHAIEAIHSTECASDEPPMDGMRFERCDSPVSVTDAHHVDSLFLQLR